MYSAADNRLDLIVDTVDVIERPCPSTRWETFPYSCIAHHGAECCDVAREWVLAYDFAQLNGADPLSGPRWLRQKYKWGPSPWPMHWCEAVERDKLDCGAHGAIAHELFTARGVTSFPAQFVQQYSEDATRHWGCKWGEEDVPAAWIDGDLIYHEGCAVLAGDGEIKLWDASAGWWINARQAGGGYGSLAAVRIFADGQWGGGDGFRWGVHRIKPNEWHQI
jgi:hypothetical protein